VTHAPPKAPLVALTGSPHALRTRLPRAPPPAIPLPVVAPPAHPHLLRAPPTVKHTIGFDALHPLQPFEKAGQRGHFPSWSCVVRHVDYTISALCLKARE
jgi:hypothetical protein